MLLWVLIAKLRSMKTIAMDMPAAGCEWTSFARTLSAVDFCFTLSIKGNFKVTLLCLHLTVVLK